MVDFVTTIAILWRYRLVLHLYQQANQLHVRGNIIQQLDIFRKQVD